MQIQHKTIVITGASGGLGSELAKCLAPNNRLILIARNAEALNKVQTDLPGEHDAIAADLGTPDGRRQVISRMAEQGRTIDYLINNAGQNYFSSLDEQKPERIESLLAVNLAAPIILTKSLMPMFSHDGTRVVFVGSTFGSIGYPGFSSYSASKFGLRGFSESLSREWSHAPHSAIYIAPRGIKTAGNTNTVVQLNSALGNTMDPPALVAQQLIAAISTKHSISLLGWPEKILAPLNSLFPQTMGKIISKQLPTIKLFMKEAAHASH